MKSKLVVTFLVLGLLVISLGSVATQETKTADKWAFNATLIEACSCPMFCQCFFNTKPAGHHEGDGGTEHYCRFNIAYQVNEGHYDDVKLDGVNFWVTGDLGGDISEYDADWGVLTFDPSVTEEQREAIKVVWGQFYPMKWKSFTVAEDAEIEWQHTKGRAEARLDGGKIAEMVLNSSKGMTDDPVVIKNIRYFGAPRNDGLVMMPNEVTAYRLGDKAFDFKGTTGFMLTLDITSEDVE